MNFYTTSVSLSLRSSLSLLSHSATSHSFSPSAGVLCFSELFFVKEPRDVIVLRKDAVVLDCRAQGEAPVHVRWLKNGSPFAESERAYLLANGSLFISEVENRRGDQSDEGLYQCLAQNKYGAILSQKARLTIASKFKCPLTVTKCPSQYQSACQIPRLITVLPTGVLQIQGVEQRDAGNYRCVAANIANRRRSAEAALTVTPGERKSADPRPRIIAGPQNVTVATHGSVLLECVAVGNPRPLISWSRADHKSIDVYNTKVLGNGNLLISDVKHEHGGVYMCRATTPGTRNYTVAVANITVLGEPGSLTRPRAGTGRFVCEADGVPRPRITWLKNGEPIHSNGPNNFE
uniref:Ig-like domain-containing protein n=1 Tax=Electrophorus electricus TaxID=8005 RepID=A0AAY5EPB2_ELEEL